MPFFNDLADLYGMEKYVLVDTHSHIYASELSSDREGVMQRAREAGVGAILMPNIDQTSIEPMLELESAYPGLCRSMMGLHPCYVKEDWEVQLALVRDSLAKRRFIAVGEIGLDFHWDLQFKEQQFLVFRAQLEMALQYDLPVAIHSRSAIRECLDIVREVGKGHIRGVFHCFGGSLTHAEAVMELGMYMGIGGVVTYKKSGLDQVLREVGLERVVLETDAPYLAPVPYRGKRNESAYLLEIAKKVAEVTGKELADVAQITTKNASDLFRVDFR